MISKQKIFLVLFFVTAVTIGQNTRGQALRDFQSITTPKVRQQQLVDGKMVNLNDVEGSRYLKDEFEKGILYDKTEGKELQVFLRYNVLEDEFELKGDGKNEILVLNKSTGYEVSLNGSKYVLSLNLPETNSGGYLNVLLEDPNSTSLYMRYFKEIVPGRKAQNSYESDKKPSISNKSYYVLKTSNDTYTKIEAHRKKAADAFPDHNKELEKYIKENKLKFRGDDEKKDLITLVKYYNQIK